MPRDTASKESRKSKPSDPLRVAFVCRLWRACPPPFCACKSVACKALSSSAHPHHLNEDNGPHPVLPQNPRLLPSAASTHPTYTQPLLSIGAPSGQYTHASSANPQGSQSITSLLSSLPLLSSPHPTYGERAYSPRASCCNCNTPSRRVSTSPPHLPLRQENSCSTHH